MRVSLFLNHACNFACTYCYGGAKFDRPMPLNVAFAGVELALRGGCGPAQVSFFGGEPLMEFERIQQVVAHARERAREGGREVRFLVPTNGSLLSGERLDWLLEQRFTVAVSLDGCRKAHDACRRLTGGGSSYDVVARNLGELLARSPVGVKVIAVLHPANAHHGADSLGALLELGVRNISMNLDYEADWDEEAREAFEAALDALGDRYVQAWRDGHVFSLNLLDSRIGTSLDGAYAPSDRCDFGCHEVAVSPRGRLYPCDRLVGEDTRDDVVIGDVFSGIDPVRRDGLIAAKNAVPPDCADCVLQPRCMHWCGCVNHAMTGSVGEVDGLLCWFEQRVIEQADRCASTLFAERNPGLLQRFYAPRLKVLR